MREIISIKVGQAGVQVGSACWELYCLEAGISPNGTIEQANKRDDVDYESFFEENKSGKYMPRSLFVDLEPTCIDEIRTGEHRDLFEPENFLDGKEDSGNCFATAC